MNAMSALTIPRGFKVTPEQFDQLAISNTDVRIELTSQGELIVMPPTGGTSGRKNFELSGQLRNWVKQNGIGIGFAQTGFVLPSAARRLPDAAWITKERWSALTPQQQDGFPPIAPDFVIELVSPSDLKNQRYEDLQQKMAEYLDNGVRLGWLIDPKTQTVEIYRLGQAVEILHNPKTLSGEEVLPGFILELEPIWN